MPDLIEETPAQRNSRLGVIEQDTPFIEQFDSSFSDYISAKFTPFEGPTGLVAQAVEQTQLDKIGPRLTQEDAQAKAEAQGVKLDIGKNGISDSALGQQIERAQQANARASIISRYNGGLLGKTAGELTSLLSLASDPLNLALFFAPGLGEVRAAKLLESAGESLFARAGARGIIGAAQGIEGFAATEAISLPAHKVLGDDYGLADSLKTVAYGGLLGGGLHAAGGLAVDLIKGVPRTIPPRPTVEPAKPGAAPALNYRDLDRDFGATEPRALFQPGTELRVPEAVIKSDPKRAKFAIETKKANVVKTEGPGTPELITRHPAIEPTGRTATDVVNAAASALSRPGFERTSTDLISIRDANTPELKRGTEIASTPGFARTTEEQLFLKSLHKGEEPLYINDRLAVAVENINRIDRTLARQNLRPETRERLTAERAAHTNEVAAASHRLAELGVNPYAGSQIFGRISDATKRDALRAAIAQDLHGLGLDVDALIKSDVRSGFQVGDTDIRGYFDRLENPQAQTLEPEGITTEVRLREPDPAESPEKANAAAADSEAEDLAKLKEAGFTDEDIADIKAEAADLQAADEELARLAEQIPTICGIA